ncbi:MAG: hypothetical protein GY866_05350 [Proteobacteria bacterium]|nr:hypothetical protein [Pseudomonadota bacterium]
MKSASEKRSHKPDHSKSLISSSKSQDPDLGICFVSLFDKRQIDGIDVITDLLQKQKFSIDHFEYKVIKKSEIRRPINPKLKDGPKERVIVEDKINVNANLRTVRQLEWRVLKDPENVLLVQISRAKGESFCLPLIFPNILRKEHQILVTGLTNQTKLQLISKPDLSFSSIPKPIEGDPDFKEHLIQRAGRAKGMQATARELLDFPGLPNEVTHKITQIATGKKEALSDAEAINIILLSDLYTRYLPVLQTFQEEVLEKKGSVAQLSRQFADLTDKIGTRVLVTKLAGFLGEEGVKSKNNLQVFSHLYRKLQQMKDGKLFVKGQLLDVKSLFAMLRSMICVTRSQFDPGLWSQCLFFPNPGDSQEQERQNIATINLLGIKAQKQILIKHAASSRSLLEIFIINNVHNYVFGKKIRVASQNLSEQEANIVKSAIAPQLHLKPVKEESQSEGLELFGDANHGSEKLINPVSCVASSYGFLMGALLNENLQKLLRQDTKSLIKRFGKDFFDIFYEQAVVEAGLPISRNQLAHWIGAKQITTRIEELGYFTSDLEKAFDPALAPEVLVGNGQSVFPITYTSEEFAKDYVEKRDAFLGFLGKLKKLRSARQEEFNPAGIFVDFMEQGKYGFLSPLFRRHTKGTFLFNELNDIVVAACKDIASELTRKSINNKAILKIPLEYESILYLGNTFDVPVGKGTIRVRLQTIPVRSVDEHSGVSHSFAKSFSAQLQQAETQERQGLIQAIRIMGEIRKFSTDYYKYLNMTVLDRQIHKSLREQQKNLRGPDKIKYGFEDSQKMIVGNIRKINLAKLVRFDRNPKKSQDEAVDNQTFGQMLEAILYCKSVEHDLEVRTETIGNIRKLLGKFSKSLKEGQEWKSYSKMIAKFDRLVSLPVEVIDEKTIRSLSEISVKMNKLVSRREYKDNAVAILHAEWKRKNPSRKKDVYFYLPFLDTEFGSKSNLLQEIRKAGELFRKLKQKKCLMFFPEAVKKIHLKQMAEIVSFIRQEAFDLDVYVETGTLDEEKTGLLSKTFNPDLFFRLDKLNPVKMDSPKNPKT